MSRRLAGVGLAVAITLTACTEERLTADSTCADYLDRHAAAEGDDQARGELVLEIADITGGEISVLMLVQLGSSCRANPEWTLGEVFAVG